MNERQKQGFRQSTIRLQRIAKRMRVAFQCLERSVSSFETVRTNG